MHSDDPLLPPMNPLFICSFSFSISSCISFAFAFASFCIFSSFSKVTDFRGRSLGLHSTSWGLLSWYTRPLLGRTSLSKSGYCCLSFPDIFLQTLRTISHWSLC
eukprot:GFUD01022734.1.p1 GENE.GFUD01022734.1~~GFUD01022734.1.p1  ORF type:complete len:104 (-),score=6.24 GFUD01022734.1:82-393(-)